MNPLPVLSFVIRAEVRNRVRQQVKRLRQPKYLVATIVGMAYLWWFALRRAFFLGGPLPRTLPLGAQERVLSGVELAVLLGALFQVSLVWLLPGNRSQFGFSEAEVQFLFPAPVTRTWLVNFKLLKRLLGILIATSLTVALMSRGIGAIGAHPRMFATGAGLAFVTLYLHRIAAAFTKERLRENRRIGALGVWLLWVAAVGFFGLSAWNAWEDSSPLLFEGGKNFALGVQALLAAKPLRWILVPFRWVLDVMLARDGPAFWRALPPALAMVGAHYIWLLLVLTPFEESALLASELRARMSGAGRGRYRPPSKVLALRLTSRGPSEVALIWKNWIGAIRKVGPRAIATTFALGVAVLSLVAATQGARGGNKTGAGVAFGAVFLLALLVLMGPTIFRADLRHELKRMDVLRSWPLTGVQIAAGEVLASGLMLLGFEFLALSVALWFSASVFPLSLSDRLSVALAVAAVLPGVTLLGILIQNAAALLFPSWVGTGEARVRGLEATGQRLLTAAGTLLVLIVGLLPAGVIGGIVFLIAWPSLHFFAFSIAGGFAGALLLAEFYIGLLGLGRLFDGHDVADSL